MTIVKLILNHAQLERSAGILGSLQLRLQVVRKSTLYGNII